jgi:hypothetical protein
MNKKREREQMPFLTAMRLDDWGIRKGWAVVSNDERQPLTEKQAERIIVSYMVIEEILRSARPDKPKLQS